VPEDAGDFSLGCGNPNTIASLRPGEVVLDIGSGGGLDAFIAAGRVGAEGSVIGVDMTPAMLARATASAEKAGIQNVEFREGYAEHLPVEDASVDVVLSNCVINLCEDKGQVFREAFRTLKPGGRLAVSDMVCNMGMPAYLRERAGEWAECISGALPEQEYLDLVSAAGFVDVCARHSQEVSPREGEIVVYSAAVTARKPAEGEKPSADCPSCCN
jgi:ubiquinone/menaquinone biosynthesis C-methylase UbiE